MRNLIKKILKESDELNWIKDIQPTLGEVFKSATENDPRIVVYLFDDGTIANIDDENGYAYWRLGYRKLNSPEDLLDLAETNINDWDYTDKNYDDWCHFRDVVIKTFFPNMNNNLNESDELDWIRDTQPWIPFEEAKIGDVYNIEKDEILLDAILACDDDTFIYHRSTKAEVRDKGYNSYDNIYCESDNRDEVIVLQLKFLTENDRVIGSFWVTEDMVALYPIYEGINESEENPLQWIEDIPAGIELQPNTLYYFEPSLTFYEMSVLANSIINSPGIKGWLLRRLEERREGGIKYFVTRDDVNKSIRGWCTETDIDLAKQMYPGIEAVNGRKEFRL